MQGQKKGRGNTWGNDSRRMKSHEGLKLTGEEERPPPPRPVPPISAWHIDDQTANQIIQTTLAQRQSLMASITSGQTGPPFGPPPPPLVIPTITLKALIIAGERTGEGVLIESVALSWFDILDYFRRHPTVISWAMTQAKSGQPEAAAIDIKGIERVTTQIIGECTNPTASQVAETQQ